MSVNLTQYRGTVGAFNTRKSIFQWICKTFFSLNYVNINNSQHYPFSTFILLVFLLLGLKHNGPKNGSMKLFVLFLFLIGFLLNIYFGLHRLLILLSGDVEINPGPTRNPKASLSICHWNLNGISAHNYIKLCLLRAYLVLHKFHIICFSERYLNSSTPADDETCKYRDTI